MENSAVETFLSFINEDHDFYQNIQAHLSVLNWEKRIHFTSSDDILPGEEEVQKRREFLKRANIIALLISPAYLHSDVHYHELEQAMKLRQESSVYVIPILLKPGNYENAPFASLKVLPRDGKPISQWYEKSDEALQEIATEMKKLLQEIALQASPESSAFLWMVPYPRNPLFTGGETELQAITEALKQRKNAAIGQIQAISGLGDIGKTQIALEYICRHRQEYRYIFWVLADTRDTLNVHYSQIAEKLHLPGKNQPELHYIVTAVKATPFKSHELFLTISWTRLLLRRSFLFCCEHLDKVYLMTMVFTLL